MILTPEPTEQEYREYEKWLESEVERCLSCDLTVAHLERAIEALHELFTRRKADMEFYVHQGRYPAHRS
jgi:hypothetical protein